jgi:hypothetical protein
VTGGRITAATSLVLLSLLSRPPRARAEVSLAKVGDDWEFYSTGRVGAFLEVLKGDGIPQVYDATGQPVHPVGNGGIAGLSDPLLQPDGTTRQGPLLAFRVRSGFLGNILGVGVRRPLGDHTTLSTFIAIWATTETDSRRTFFKNFPDEREAYMKVEGPAGTLVFGRTLSLFSRGATEIDFLYGHGYGVGNPAGFDTNGPSAGHIGYGVLAAVFVAGIAYATPVFHGLQLTAGYYDPATFVGLYWTRTKLGRPEAEATYDAQLGASTRLHLFLNGAWQKMYATDVPRSTDVYGAGAGARLEVGPLHLGVAGHYGQGLGVHYALDGSDAVVAQFTTQRLRKFDGAYVQSQLALGAVDISLGWGITRVHRLPEDYDPQYYDPNPNLPQRSFLRSQMGISAVVVYHVSKTLHVAADYFRADARWWLGEEQVVHGFNLGSTVTW